MNSAPLSPAAPANAVPADAYSPFLPGIDATLLLGRIRDLDARIAALLSARHEELTSIEAKVHSAWSRHDITQAQDAALHARAGSVDCLSCETLHHDIDCPACGRHPPDDEAHDEVPQTATDPTTRVFNVSVSVSPCITTILEIIAKSPDEASDLAINELLTNPNFTVLDFNGNAVELQADDICVDEAWEPDPQRDDVSAIIGLRQRRAALWSQFEQQGCRGVELADELDAIDREIAALFEPRETTTTEPL